LNECRQLIFGERMAFKDELSNLERSLETVDFRKVCSPEVYKTVDKICEGFAHSSAEERQNLVRVSKKTRIALLGYAWHAAQEAVRTDSAELVWKGLLAMVIEGGRTDVRDNIVRLAVLFNSARLLKLDPSNLFGQAANLSDNPALSQQIRGFPERAPEHRGLPAFYTKEAGQGKDFTYTFFPNGVPRKFDWLRRFWKRR
jgi:hypothetical protein